MFCKLSSLSITTHSAGTLPCHHLPSDRIFHFKVQIHFRYSRGASHLKDLAMDLITPFIGVRHPSDSVVYKSSNNCSPASDSSVSAITASYLKWMKCPTSGYINLHFLWSQIIHIMSFSKSRTEEVPVIWIKMLSHLKKAYMLQRNYTFYVLILYIRDKHYQSVVQIIMFYYHIIISSYKGYLILFHSYVYNIHYIFFPITGKPPIIHIIIFLLSYNNVIL